MRNGGDADQVLELRTDVRLPALIASALSETPEGHSLFRLWLLFFPWRASGSAPASSARASGSALPQSGSEGAPLQANCARAVACPTTFARAGAHTKLHALLSPAPRNAKTAKSTRATDTDAYAKQSLCESRSDETAAAARVGRASGSAAAGVRLHLASLLTPSTKAPSHPAPAN